MGLGGMNDQLIICERAGMHRACKQCLHATQHKVCLYDANGSNCSFPAWCEGARRRVACIAVEKKEVAL